MIIKEEPAFFFLLPAGIHRTIHLIRNWKFIVGLLVLILVASIFIVIGFLAGVIAHKSDAIGRMLDRQLLRTPLMTTVTELLQPYAAVASGVFQENLRIPANYLKGLSITPERILIDVKFKDFQKLQYKRNQALSEGLLNQSADDFVPAEIRKGDQTVRVKLRLKGDILDHLYGDKWSFRVKCRAENTLWGMKLFSLQHPKTRNYLYEWIFHQALEREDVLSVRYRFVNVTLNGNDLGVYAVEEHFEKRLLEHRGRKEGPILKFYEDTAWRVGAMTEEGKMWAYQTSHVDSFQTTKTTTSAVLNANYVKGTSLLELLRLGKLATHEVFDVNKLAIYYAICELMGGRHGLEFHNMRFYYNPITSRLEPIGFDANAGISQYETRFGVWIPFRFGKDSGAAAVLSFEEAVFRDPVFHEQYVRALDKVSNPQYLDNLLIDLEPELSQNLAILYHDFPYFHYSTNVFQQNQKAIRAALAPPKAFNAYVNDTPNANLEIEIGNIIPFPVTIERLIVRNLIFKPMTPTVLAPLPPGDAHVQYKTYRFAIPEGFQWNNSLLTDTSVEYRILGTDQILTEPILSGPRIENNFVATDFMRQKPNEASFSFIRLNKDSREIQFQPQHVVISRDLILRRGYTVKIPSGFHADLRNGAKILSYSPLLATGTIDDPIVIESTDGSGQGLLVLKTDRESLLQHVIFRNLSPPQEDRWSLTGTVTFYEASVKITHTLFAAAQAEDSLNIVRSQFSISDSAFVDSQSDAFDSDFSEGQIINTRFVNSGNDAVDLSGSTLTIDSVIIDGFKDKGLSAGERSNLVGHNLRIANGPVAVASKDSSRITLSKLAILDSQVGLTAYRKKAEYEPAAIHASQLTMERVEVPHLIEKDSVLTLNGKLVLSDAQRVKTLMYGVKYGRASN